MCVCVFACFADPIHLEDDARFALGVAKAGVGQTGALTQCAAFELTDLLHRLLVLVGVFTHHAQLVALLKTVVVSCRDMGAVSHVHCSLIHLFPCALVVS